MAVSAMGRAFKLICIIYAPLRDVLWFYSRPLDLKQAISLPVIFITNSYIEAGCAVEIDEVWLNFEYSMAYIDL